MGCRNGSDIGILEGNVYKMASHAVKIMRFRLQMVLSSLFYRMAIICQKAQNEMGVGKWLQCMNGLKRSVSSGKPM